ncbi:MAG TPA: hypothetical protein DCS93_24020 [Microscillaceae bacterium]|nr:hypothetical protein [Microscillaceae bacterium]
MKRIKFWIRNYFGFSKKETNGFIIIVTIMILSVSGVLVYPYVAGKIFGNRQVENLDQNTLDSLEALIDKQTAELAAKKDVLKKEYEAKKASTSSPQKKKKRKKFVKEPAFQAKETFAFDPNVATIEEWQKLGFSARLSKRIHNYVSKGGRFHQKSDIKKIYGFPDEAYDHLVSYIQLPDKRERKYASSNPYESGQKFKKRVITPFELNEADTAQLKQISGIGEKLSARIVKYRESLGGFVNPIQLKDVYGLKPEVIEELLKYASIKPETIKKINVNTATYEQLKTHPYIRYKLAKIIVNYREHHGKYTSMADLGKIKILDQETLEKLEPYIGF